MKILNNINEVLFESAAETMRQTVLDAIAAGANLIGANLSGVDLSDANLSGANLIGANLIGANLSRANLIGANLSGANLSGANLSGVDLSDANLSGANLIGADLIGANLSRADLSRARLSHAYLAGAYLVGANLAGANLVGTCLSPDLHTYARQFAQTCKPVGQHGGRIVYRTAHSAHVGATQYTVGKTFVANALSWDAATACHPGIYAYGTLAELREEFPNAPAMRCYVRDGDYTINAKNAIRCARLRVLGEVK